MRKCKEMRLNLRFLAWAPGYEIGKEVGSVAVEGVYTRCYRPRKFGLTLLPFREAWLLCANPRACVLDRGNNVGKSTGTGNSIVGLLRLQLPEA